MESFIIIKEGIIAGCIKDKDINISFEDYQTLTSLVDAAFKSNISASYIDKNGPPHSLFKKEEL